MLDTAKIYTSKNSGDFEVIEYKNSKSIRVRFVRTGYECFVQDSQIRSGYVKDRFYPSVYGVGFIGVGRYKPSSGNKNTKAYSIWSNMLKRCYCHKTQRRQPTYKGCTVCVEWHNYQNFAKWFEVNYIKGLHLDKDIRSQGEKVYSPETCMFVTCAKNNEKARAKGYKMTSPDGSVVNVYNMKDFCRDNGLNDSHMCAVYYGKRKQHKGWTKAGILSN